MQLEGTAKRKRKSSDSNNGCAENSPVAESKRLKVEDSKTGTGSSVDERLPLAELPVQPESVCDGEGDSETDWLDACTDSLLLTDERLSPDPEADSKQKSENEAEDLSLEQTQPAIKTDDEGSNNAVVCSPSIETLKKLFSRSHNPLRNKLDLMNFFKRRGTTGAADRTDELFEYNPGLQPKMRSVLLEWIIEVCDVYKLYRETYHLAVDYLDRYLSKSTNISKGQLQLIGVTALLIAAKYEEIYPPRISDFAYITDGACTEQDIIKMENLMVQVLEWRCKVITSNAWLLGFLQLLCFQESQNCETEDVFCPLYNVKIYETVAHLMDLCSLDSGFLRYPYKVLALASIHTVIAEPNPTILSASGYSYEDIESCLNWMEPFWRVLCQKFSYESIRPRVLAKPVGMNRSTDFAHMRIKHNIDLEILEAVHVEIETQQKREELEDILLTPPRSSEKRRKSRDGAIK